METPFFGDFLVARGFANSEATAAAAQRMREVNQSIARIAQERGWLTASQVQLIHVQQLLHNRLWGEQAIELGLLDADQVARLLADQRARHLRLGEALLELDLIGRDALDRALALFAEARLQEASRARVLPAVLERCEAARWLLEHFPTLVLRIANLPTRLGATREWKGEEEADCGASIALRGDVALEIGIAAERGFVTALAEGWRRRPHADADRALLLDVLGKLLAVLAGNARTALENCGIALEPGLPEAGTLPDAGTAIDFATPDARGLLVLSRR